MRERCKRKYSPGRCHQNHCGLWRIDAASNCL